MYKACIFDLDGTLLNTLDTIAYYSNKALEHFGFQKLPQEKYQVLCRLSYKEYYETLLRFGGCPEGKIDELRDIIGAYDQKVYMEDYLYLTRPFDGISAVLKELKEKGITLAVLTNKPDHIAKNIIASLFPDMFHLCVGHIAGNPSKPDPHSLLALIQQLSLSKEECLYAGDTDIDILTAKRAEVFSIATAWGYQTIEMLQSQNPDVIIHRPEEILYYFR